MSGLSAITPPWDVNLWVGPFDPRLAATSLATAANYARFFAFTVARPVTVTQAFLYINVSAGNLDVGIYDSAGNRLASSGSVASPGTTTRSIALTASLTLHPGRLYYAAYASNDGTFAISAPIGNPTYAPTPAPALNFYVAASFPLPTSVSVPANNVNTNVAIVCFGP